MLTETRQTAILRLLQEKGSITLQELKTTLGASESTIRRDLNTLDREGKLCKVFGGAIPIDSDETITITEDDVSAREARNQDEKQAIARHAASMITASDFVYLDAGTTTGHIIPFLPETGAFFVTNAISHARALAAKGLKVILLGGEVKPSTEAVVGHSACTALSDYHFSLGFFGTNGVHKSAGFTTPDPKEADVKRAALNRCRRRFVLCDHEKFNTVTPVTFADFDAASILTSAPLLPAYGDCKNIITVP